MISIRARLPLPFRLALPGTVTVAVAAMLALCTGCGGSTPRSAASSAGSAASSSGSATSAVSSSGSAADAAEIRQVYLKFFNASITVAQTIALLQDGADFRATLDAQSNTATAQEASVTVSRVTVNSADKATVIFTLLLKGSPVLPDQTGYAVREGGSWKVAGSTFCELLMLQGAPPPACSKPAATALPN